MSQQGTRIGPYALQVQVGRTAGCTVWHAARADGKSRGPSKVAVRLLDDPGDHEAQGRLELEYHRLKAMDGVGAPLPVAHYAGFGALVMEQRLGSTLRALLDASMAATLDLDPATALEIALGAARTLRHAHQLPDGLVHGRLAPADILLGRDSTVTLMGWGGWSPQAWSPGVAPEVMRGQAPSAYADMYGLGAILCTMLEPRLTQSQGLQAAVHRVVRGWPAAGRLLQNLLGSDPGGRYPDMGPIIHELLALQRHHGGVARVGELAERCGSFRRGGGSAIANLNATQGPAAPVKPKLPPVMPPPVVPTPAPAETPATPAKTEPPPVEANAPEPPSPAPTGLPEPVPPEPVPAATPEADQPAPAPEAAQPPPAETAEPPPAEPEPEKTEPIVEAPPPPDRALTGYEHDDDHPEDDPDDGASMQLIERVALAVVGLLGLLLLAWLGRACIGG